MLGTHLFCFVDWQGKLSRPEEAQLVGAYGTEVTEHNEASISPDYTGHVYEAPLPPREKSDRLGHLCSMPS